MRTIDERITLIIQIVFFTKHIQVFHGAWKHVAGFKPLLDGLVLHGLILSNFAGIEVEALKTEFGEQLCDLKFAELAPEIEKVFQSKLDDCHPAEAEDLSFEELGKKEFFYEAGKPPTKNGLNHSQK